MGEKRGRYFSSGEGSKTAVQVEDLASSGDVAVFEPVLNPASAKEDHARRRLFASLKHGKKNDEKLTKKPGSFHLKKDRRRWKPEQEEEKLEPVPVPEEKLNKYYRDEPVDLNNVKTKFGKSIVKAREAKFEQALRFTAKSELMLMESAGFIEPDGEDASALSQHQIVKNVDLITKQKVFDLKLDKFGPYRVAYTRNGRYLAMAGALGHIACFDWLPKRLMCEVNVRERCRDICWLHQETMFAVAQRRLYIYDNQGIELHCINAMDNVERLEFLPYHFLLTAAHSSGFLSYLDVSVGKMVASYPTYEGAPLNVMCQNPTNAIIHLGHRGGTVTLWSPNVKESLMKILCHTTPVQSVCVDPTGNYMATSALDRRLSIWDLRQQSQKLASVKLPFGASSLSYSQRGLLAASLGQFVQVFDPKTFLPNDSENVQNVEVLRVNPYLKHSVTGQIENVRFCPFEDVLGIGYETGVASILVPGSGEPNFDALETNPYMSKTQRREQEVRQLLDKIQPELIEIDPSRVLEVHRPSLIEREEKKRKTLLGKPDQLVIEPRQRVRGLPIEKRKRIFKGEMLQKRNEKLAEQSALLKNELKKSKKSAGESGEATSQKKPKSSGVEGVLSRFSKTRKS